MFKIGKSDWILYKKKLAAWQNNHMQHLLEEYQEIINSKGEPVDRFWELEKRINKDKRKRGVVCELSRSSVIDNLLTLLCDGVITFDELEDFSEDLQNTVLAYKQIYDLDFK